MPTEPRLRLDTTMHTGMIWTVDTDRSGRRIVTGAEDKTARLWRASDGQLLRVFRPPIRSGDHGRRFGMTSHGSAAISPDGGTVAVAGSTVDTLESGNESTYVYLFDAPSGRLERRLGGLSGPVADLAFSGDGERLVAGLFEGNGVRVWRLRDAERVLTDTDYGRRVHRVAFGPNGRLAATSDDGAIRVYGPDGQRRARRDAPDGDAPYGVAFHPDGDHLAVGYRDTSQISVLETATLERAYRVDTQGLDNGSLEAVAWSADGSALYAAGTYYNREGSDERLIIDWANAGRGTRSAMPGPDSQVTALAQMPGGGLVYGSTWPALGHQTVEGVTAWHHDPPIPDMRDKLGNGFRLSADGRKVAFGLGRYADQPVIADLGQRAVRSVDEMPGDFDAPKTEGLSVTDWNDSKTPELDGETLVLKYQPYNVSRSLAVAPDGERFALGTSFSLALFDDAGNQLWGQPGRALGVNIPKASQLVVGAFADGTVRWYRLKDGQRLLTLFVHRQTQEWVAWTPSGYYDASAGGEQYIGWHVNRGKAKASDFFDAGRFRDRFHRPEIVSMALEAVDEADAIARATGAQDVGDSDRGTARPVVELRSPQHGAEVEGDTITVEYTVRSPSGATVSEIQVLADWRPVKTLTREITFDEADAPVQREVELALPDGAVGETRLGVIAATADRRSQPALVTVTVTRDE